MNNNPITEKHIGVLRDNWDGEKFSDVRHKAQNEFLERKLKAKRNKNKKEQINVPKLYPGKSYIIAKKSRSGTIYYYHCEVVDFYEDKYGNFVYYTILLKTTNKKSIQRIGRLYRLLDAAYEKSFAISKLSYNSIDWLPDAEEGLNIK